MLSKNDSTNKHDALILAVQMMNKMQIYKYKNVHKKITTYFSLLKLFV
jgi:hypothetical protein